MSRLASLGVSLASCDLIMPEPESPPEVVLLVFTGLFEFDQDTVRVPVGDTLVLTPHPKVGGLPEPGPRQVVAPYRRFIPKAIRCTDVAGEIDTFPLPAPCPVQRDHYGTSRPDSAIIVRLGDEAMLNKVYRVLPCANPDAVQWQGGFGECAASGGARTTRGPGIAPITRLRGLAVECGMTWMAMTERGNWPDPFDGTARVEVEITGC